ncbi:DUF1641 domain-containing protein [Metabacillus sp. KIGAM252]|uniref:DUF1641 domain-containing protein n=1 Tax=Metabacillus flavus TaxID=2823519 RepID=A0ABS5LHH9_9BACI|nr:DUF1641 domain-containing protein [Metabacillus flavus]MBS2970216.1 DUF1641 domain-containing protein [Metabacillus flavus]
MANATTKIKKLEISEEDQRKKDLREVEDALVSNKTAILESLQLMQHIQDRGILSLLNGLFGQGDKVLHVLVKALDKPENTNALKNMLLMLGVLGTINVQQLEPLLIKLNKGVERVAKKKDTDHKTGYLDVVRSLKDPEINRAVTLLLTFLKGVGEETEHMEKNKQQEAGERVDLGENG